MIPGWSASEPEASAIRAALPAAALDPSLHGAVASVLIELEGRLVDGATVLGTPEIFVRPLPQHDRAGLDTWLALLERRRGQLAHDASGPATGILAALETVLEYERIPESSRVLLDEARAGVLRLTAWLGDRSAALSGQPNVVAGSLRSLLTHTARALIDGTNRDRIELEVDASDETVRLDATLLEGSLAVMLSNAWRFRRGQEARVRVEGMLEAGSLRVSVDDEGRGLTSDTLRRAGELGYTTRPNGVGLGLFLLRRAVSARGGAVLLQAKRGGTRATVLLQVNGATAR